MQLTRRPATLVCSAFVAVAALAGCSSSSGSTPLTGGTPTTTTPTTSPSSTPVAAAKPTCPLTGLPPTKGQNINRPALAVKIDNVDGALPQSGLNSADVVFEELVEGGLTRLMAIFQCSSTGTVGPIRSARISDANILALLHGSILGFSGANPKDLPPIVAHSHAVLIAQGALPQYFYRSTVHAAPHNVYSSTKQLVHAGKSRRHSLHAPKPLFTYGPILPVARPARHVSLTWSYATSADWTWAKTQWLRTQNGSPDVVASGGQVHATNVVVLSVKIASTGLRDVLGNPSPEDVTVGHNKVWVMRNGKIIRGTWTRKTIGAPFVFRSKFGHVITLAPGRTWVELLPTPMKPKVSRH
jgi:Protein of unknown function (DUF3048) N-terminal domain/Protein of unknown function (DUF3048) C-terminal domain